MASKRYSTVRPIRRRSRGRLLLTAALVAASLSPAYFYAHRPTSADIPMNAAAERKAEVPPHPISAPTPPVVAATLHDRSLIDPNRTLPGADGFAAMAPLASAFKAPPVASPQVFAAAAPSRPEREAVAPPEPAQTVAVAAPVPLPVPRPVDLRAPVEPPAQPAQVARAPLSRPMKVAAAPEELPSNPSFFERLFGVKNTPDSALGYASVDTNLGGGATSRLGTIVPSADAYTAVYDITAKVVTLPNGERLEAHSGLGSMMDDPRYVNVRMKGATPPGTYVLREREALFHGVRAIRMLPVGGSAAIYGRDGILAHTYMLGPNGDSNGCISFKNYDRFLQAYLRGEVKRVVVTAGSRQDLLPRVARR
ncbi:DUF2778 domain-containing protein [Microvirga pudoricolor]|uniref:DUF2778 domain-containing protein n=1 Tax=Microvirga pudoricolor TaxID=2778729 RepID=UPI00194EE699|nr:DUF2778 domain-containing protein [Microvirga pudoricolor]MBM6596492.1 DUF2778 domain-containing protein [Microvirga pudoricolor]